MPNLSPEAQKLLDARRSAIAELMALDGKQREINDADVVRLSGARLVVDSLTMRLLAGDIVSAAEFKAANEMVDGALEAGGKRVHTVEIEYVGDLETCPQCGYEKHSPPDPIDAARIANPPIPGEKILPGDPRYREYEPPTPKRPPTVIDLKAVETAPRGQTLTGAFANPAQEYRTQHPCRRTTEER
jgi:hypothetical protein